jgi:hypothetical protein
MNVLLRFASVAPLLRCVSVASAGSVWLHDEVRSKERTLQLREAAFQEAALGFLFRERECLLV